MDTVKLFIRHEPVLSAAALAAAISCLFVPPDAGYLSYIDFRTLALLYCLMTVVAGLRDGGLFDVMGDLLLRKAGTVRGMAAVLVLLCFFSSMLITNDVALITFVPFAIRMKELRRRKGDLIRILVLQTAAANLGSMLTPVGNPQNLYLYSRYHLGFADFLRTTLPVWGLALVLVLLLCLLLPREPLAGDGRDGEQGNAPARTSSCSTSGMILYGLLFLVCLLVVLRLLPWPAMLLTVLLVLWVKDRRRLLEADLLLLLTFSAFFIFSGNLARLDAVNTLLRRLLDGREYLTALLLSQVISNVPAALLLSGFTEAVKPLLLGVNIGGLGTPVASLASLITLKFYTRTEGAETGRFLAVFSAVNAGLLLVLSLAARLII